MVSGDTDGRLISYDTEKFEAKLFKGEETASALTHLLSNQKEVFMLHVNGTIKRAEFVGAGEFEIVAGKKFE